MTGLTADLMLTAYRRGAFPMGVSRASDEIVWLAPRQRGVLPLDGGFHVSRSLARRMRRGDYAVTLDRAFAEVVDACADRPETWINAEIRQVYLELFARGHAHSLEIWMDGALAGGVFGVALGAAFFGESMFSRRTDASKLALAHLTAHLRRQGFVLFDTQFLTDHLASLGAVEIPREEYLRRLALAVPVRASFGGPPSQEVVQRSTQTS